MRPLEREYPDVSRRALRDFVDAQRLLLIIGHGTQVQQNLKKYCSVLLTKDIALNFEVDWLEAHIDYHAGNYVDCCTKLHELSKRIKNFSKNTLHKEITLGRFFLCRVHLLAGKSFRRRHDLFMAKIHFGLGFCYCERTLEFRDILDGNHYLPDRIRMLYVRLFIHWKERGFAEKLLGESESAMALSFQRKNLKKVNHQHLYFSELYQLRGRLHSIRDRPVKTEDSEALKKYKQAADLVKAVLRDEPHRRHARISRLIGFHKADIIFKNAVERGGNYLPGDLKKIDDAISAISDEIKERDLFFDKKPHPTIIRAHNNMAFTFIQKTTALLQLSRTDQLVREAVIGAKEASELLKKADNMNRRKSINTPKVFSSYLNDNQNLATLRRKTQLHELEYFNSVQLGVDKQVAFNNAWACYQEAETVSNRIKMGLSTTEDRDEYASRMHHIQELILKILNDYQQGKTGKSKVDVLIKTRLVFRKSKKVHEWRTSHSEEPRQPERQDLESEHKRTVKVFIRRMMSAGRNMNRTGPGVEDTRLNTEEYERFVRDAEKIVFRYDEDLKRKKVADGDRVGGDGTYKSPFHPVAPPKGAIVIYFAGLEHLYALLITARPGRAGEKVRFLRLTKEPYTEVHKIKEAGKLLHVTINAIINAEKTQLDMNGEILCQLSQEFIESNPKGGPHPNLTILSCAHELYKGVVAGLELDKLPVKKVYFILDKWMWLNVPLSMLLEYFPKEEICAEPGFRFSRLKDGFLGAKYEIATMPSLDNMRHLGNVTRKQIGMIDAKTITMLSTGHYALASFHTTNNIKDSLDNPTINSFGRKTVVKIEKKLNLFLNEDGLKSVCFPATRRETNINMEDEICKAISKAYMCYFQGHTRKMDTFKLERSLELHDDKDPGPVLETRNASTHYELTREEITGHDLANLFLTFINACSSISGENQGVQMPNSLFTAFLEAGCRVVIGTGFKVVSHSAERFALLFFEALFAGEGVTVGQARLATIRKMIDVDDFCANPLRWGAYSIMGDMDSSPVESIRRLLYPPIKT